jgi:glycine/D-amino acid oxidase-like deaminating enzyme/nitrite reductase/ring-hydroxylating ferredoxin subunit
MPPGGKTLSYWLGNDRAHTREPLTADAQIEVCVIGAGIAGLTTAYLLASEGRRVIVVDDGPVAGGETGRTTAHLTNVMDDRFVVLERDHGKEGSRMAAESHGAAIDRIESIVRTEQIDCEFVRVDGYLFVPPDESTDILDDEFAAATRAGMQVERLPRAPMPLFDSGPCLRFAKQAQFHPLRYVNALARAIEKNGGRIYGSTHVQRVEAGTPARVITNSGPVIVADFVVCATNTPVIDWVSIHTKQAAYRTYAIAAPLSAGSMPRVLLWDTATPYHYVRLQDDVLIVGGEDHKTGQQDDGIDRFARLESWTRQRFPIGEVQYSWSGQIIEPVDGLAFIGRDPGNTKNIFVATGDSGQGMTHGTIAGILLTDLIQGRPNPWEALYDPSRKITRSIGEFVHENLNAVKHFAEYVSPGQMPSEEQIAPGQGAIVRSGLHKVAVYRESGGVIHRLSATCPHMGCIVHWNGVEKTWDCPCHGSRFAPAGEVINGPAISGLKKSEERAA